ncbi:MAG TPA: terminase family protein [Allosphingosinicella sp.]|nr:terminase family protein [Allosphingosinicella sp.]
MGKVDRLPATFRELADTLSPAEQERFVCSLTLDEARAADLDWPGWAHEGQFEPEGRWSTWVIKGGRGFGKTKAGAEWIAGLVRNNGDSHFGQSPASVPIRIALVGATLDEVRRVMVEGPCGLLEVAHDQIADWSPSLRRLRFRSGAEATLFSGASPEALRGPEHEFAWCDELAKWRHAQASWDMLQLGLRRGKRPRALVTTTPRPGPVLKGIMAAPGCVTTGGPSWANPHVPSGRIEEMRERYAGTRLARQELEGELLPDVAGALWTVDLLERCRIGPGRTGSEGSSFRQVLIGVDPPIADGTCGIVACGLDQVGRGHVLGDHSVTDRSPEGWARAVVAAAQAHGATLAVAEANQGGRMVESVLRAASEALRVKLVYAADGKSARADPVATLFEAGRVTLHGRWDALEAELCGMIAGGGYEGPGTSPDRADAMVWALTELMLQKVRAEPRIRRL